MIDMHVHYFPPAVFRAIWRFFETRSKGLWPIRYKLFGERHFELLKSAGVERCTTLVYAHKPGMASYLNNYILEESKRNPALIPFGTIYAGDENPLQEARSIFEDFAFYGIKLHPFVSNEELDDQRFFPIYEMMESMGKVLICHPGSGPVYHNTNGADRLRAILKQFPKLKIVVAHCGAFEYGDYSTLGEDFENVYYDTAMNCIHHDVFENNCPGKEFFIKYQDRVLYGSDYPNIPYEYLHQKDSILHLKLGETVEQKIFSKNAKRLLGIE